MAVELFIQHNSTIQFPVVEEGARLTLERKGTPGKLEFTVVKGPGLNFAEGDPVKLTVNGTAMFYGFVFKKKRDKGGTIDVVAYVTATTDYLFLLAEFEVFGTRSYANSYEQNYQAQYDYYKAGNSRVAYNHSAVSTAVWWWLRSPDYHYNYCFQSVNTDGYNTNYIAYYCAGVRPGFAA